MRFPNEADAVKSRKGLLVRIEGDPAKVRAKSTRDTSHISETALDNYSGFDYTYKNDKTLAELEEFAKLVLLATYNKW